tara:strand:- start:1395 stop:1775 length:381 start_codon:yes stop_codon:yes gene_type:complete
MRLSIKNVKVLQHEIKRDSISVRGMDNSDDLDFERPSVKETKTDTVYKMRNSAYIDTESDRNDSKQSLSKSNTNSLLNSTLDSKMTTASVFLLKRLNRRILCIKFTMFIFISLTLFLSYSYLKVAL